MSQKTLPNIEGIDNPVNIDIMLPTTSADVTEEVSECLENKSLHISNKIHDLCSIDKIDKNSQYI